MVKREAGGKSPTTYVQKATLQSPRSIIQFARLYYSVPQFARGAATTCIKNVSVSTIFQTFFITKKRKNLFNYFVH